MHNYNSGKGTSQCGQRSIETIPTYPPHLQASKPVAYLQVNINPNLLVRQPVSSYGGWKAEPWGATAF